MSGSRRKLAWVAAAVVCGLVGCWRAPASTDGGAAGRRPERARRDAEALALSAIDSAAVAQAKVLPELYRMSEPPPEMVRERRAAERLPAAVRGVAGTVAVALAGFLFLRFTRRASGARTLWLALLAVALAAGGVATAVLVSSTQH